MKKNTKAFFNLGVLFFYTGLSHLCGVLLFGDFIKDSVITSSLLQISGVAFVGSATAHFLTKE